MARIRREVPNAEVEAESLDLADLKSVRAFAARVSAKPLNLLINNAGVMGIPKREVTVDGFERQFGTNFLGPFALTGLLMPALLQTRDARVVTISSGMAEQGKIDFDNLQSEKSYNPMMGAYALSKLADLMFTLELQRRADAAAARLVSTAAHPGYAITNLQSTVTGGLMYFGMQVLKPFFSQDAAAGALPTLYAAIAGKPGGYYGPDGPLGLKGAPGPAKVPARAKDVAVAKRLWEVAERLTGVVYREL